MKKLLFLFCIALASCTSKAQGVLPEFSTEEAPVWYYIQFKTGGGILSDEGTGKVMKTATAAAGPNQVDLIGEQKNFYL